MAKATLPKPLYAYVGVTDLAVEVVRDFVTETQTRLAGVQKSVSNPQALRKQAVTVVNARVDAITTEAKARRKAIEARVVELQMEAATQATDTYTDLAKRGESLVGRIRRQESTTATVKSARTTVSKAKTTNTQARKAVDAEVTATKKTNTAAKTAAKKAAATKAPVRKAAAKKTATAQSSAKATVTTAKKTAENAVKAVADATEKVGD